MKTLNERLTAAFNILIEKHVFLSNVNDFSFCLYRDQLQLITNYLSCIDFKIMLSVCELYNLQFSVNYVPSLTDNNLCVIFEDSVNE